MTLPIELNARPDVGNGESAAASDEPEDNKPDVEGPIPRNPVLPVLPMSDVVLFPAMIAPLVVSTSRSLKLVDDVVAGDRMFIAALQRNRDAADDQVEPEEMHEYGCVARLLRTLKFPDQTTRILVQGLHRCRLGAYEPGGAFLRAHFQVLPEIAPAGLEIEALTRNASLRFQEVITMSPTLPEELKVALFNMEDPAKLSDLVAANLNMELGERQSLLQENRVAVRLQTLTRLLNREREVLRIGNEIQSKVSETFSKNQREYFLREQLKAIRKELGEHDPASADQEQLRAKLDAAKLPEDARKAADKELERLQSVPPISPEYGVIRTYLDLMSELPWSVATEDALDLERARRVLEADHYGLTKIKERMLEFLAVMKLRHSLHGPILCFVGPPGVGKTSLGQSIARALKRKFIRLSLGGVRDEAEIRGHRRTYIGAMPGRIIQGLRRSGACNPVFMLDEVDKLGMDFRGDPAAALLEVLDPEQNKSFSDHYLDVPFDLSKTLFITTANVLDSIPPALRDRMEVMELSGYTTEEKVQIARRHLVRKQALAHGLTRTQSRITNEALDELATGYTREAGVRNLEREIAACYRKIARRVAAGRHVESPVTPAVIRKWLGPRKFVAESADIGPSPGVAMGLAWTAVGGEILFVEAALMPGKGQLLLTGSLGDVMKESARAALTLLRMRGEDWGWPAGDHEKTDVHVHVPAGAIPKDGPSAGVAIFLALASRGLNLPIPSDLAMTGEITLRGRVLPVGGVKEKVLAAVRAGARRVLLPSRNKDDVREVPAEVRRQVRFIYISSIDDTARAAGLSPRKPSAKKRAAVSSRS
ncbi:MAG: endopeptidase La [Kiritimatiellae bacterium]|nr:endopeptidase La [Kiritimatiellia bacterium]